MALGIITIKSRGDQPSESVETVGNIHNVKFIIEKCMLNVHFFRKNVKEDPAEIVSGGQTQSDIRQGTGRHPGAVPGALLRHRGGEDTTHTDI